LAGAAQGQNRSTFTRLSQIDLIQRIAEHVEYRLQCRKHQVKLTQAGALQWR
jgi:hypothetical protein